jgi:hypothetical protein
MMKVFRAFLLVLVLLSAACNSGPQPAVAPKSAGATPQAGGGMMPTATQPAGELPEAPTLPTTTSHPTMAPTPSGPVALEPGQSIQLGPILFVLVDMKEETERTLISYQVEGMPFNFQPAEGLNNPYLALPDGQRLEAIEGGGGNSGGTETASFIFPNLPAGVQSFKLVIQNNWSGQVEDWTIPIRSAP